MNQFPAERYAQKLSIRYVSGPRNQLQTLQATLFTCFFIAPRVPDFESVGSDNEIQSNFAGSQTAIFKLLVSSE